MAAVLEPDVIFTSYDVISLCCRPERNIFGRSICPPSFVVTASIFSKLRGGGGISSPPPPVPEDQKKTGLNRVKAVTLQLKCRDGRREPYTGEPSRSLSH